MISPKTSDTPRFSDRTQSDVLEYRAVSGLAVVGLLMGLLSPLAFFHPALWLAPAAAIVLSLWALVRISRDQAALVGRKAAIVGLTVSLLVVCAAPVRWLTYRWIIDREARKFAAVWFDFLAADEPHKALQLTFDPYSRAPLDDQLWQRYHEGSDAYNNLESFVAQPIVRTLLALGTKSSVRYYETQSQQSNQDRDVVEQTYAVTFDDNGQKKTFFVALKMTRMRLNEEVGFAKWHLLEFQGGVRPKALRSA